MTAEEKYCVMLDVAYDIVASVHSDLCRTTERGNDITDDACDILYKITSLKERLKGGAQGILKNCNMCLFQPICNTYAALGVTDVPAGDVTPCELFQDKTGYVEVHCKKCENWKRHSGTCEKSPTGHCFYFDANMLATDFCSYGKRKEGK